ncbi:MAG: hypothetical protein ACE5J5_03795 [Candidatus Hydrothermarchaeales archaeon]
MAGEDDLGGYFILFVIIGFIIIMIVKAIIVIVQIIVSVIIWLVYILLFYLIFLLQLLFILSTLAVIGYAGYHINRYLFNMLNEREIEWWPNYEIKKEWFLLSYTILALVIGYYIIMPALGYGLSYNSISMYFYRPSSVAPSISEILGNIKSPLNYPVFEYYPTFLGEEFFKIQPFNAIYTVLLTGIFIGVLNTFLIFLIISLYGVHATKALRKRIEKERMEREKAEERARIDRKKSDIIDMIDDEIKRVIEVKKKCHLKRSLKELEKKFQKL